MTQDENIPPDDSDTPLAKEGRRIRKNWFNSLGDKDQDKIIEPKFNEEYPTNTDKQRATKEHG